MLTRFCLKAHTLSVMSGRSLWWDTLEHQSLEKWLALAMMFNGWKSTPVTVPHHPHVNHIDPHPMTISSIVVIMNSYTAFSSTTYPYFVAIGPNEISSITFNVWCVTLFVFSLSVFFLHISSSANINPSIESSLPRHLRQSSFFWMRSILVSLYIHCYFVCRSINAHLRRHSITYVKT